MAEEPARGARVDDLASLLFEHCRAHPHLRVAIAGDSSEPTRIFVGDNCRSLTTPMSDAVVSRSAAPMAIQVDADTVGHLMFVGTWHSHPLGGPHSGLDRETLRAIAKDAGGLPAVSLVWTPTGLRCAVDRW